MNGIRKFFALFAALVCGVVLMADSASAALPDLGVDADVVITDVSTAYGGYVNSLMLAGAAIALGFGVWKRLKKIF